jgi:DNA repair protein RadD
MTVELRAYQDDVIAAFEAELGAGKRRVILVAPTGSGKTIVASSIIARAVKRHQRVLVLAHRREIITQASRKLYEHGVRHGIIQAGLDKLARPIEPVQVASIQTLWSRAVRSNTMPLPPAHLLVVDEAHHAPAETYRKVIAAYPDAVLLGLTATPCRGDGHGLGGIFETMIECPQIADLIAGGYLVKSRVYAPTDPDLRGVRTVAGDYVEDQLAERMDRAKLVGDIVTHWHKYGERRRAIAFACSVGHSVHIRDEFLKSGVRAEHLDGSTPKDQRDAMLARLASGKTEVVTNCMVLTEGWDMPEVGCCILARPTKRMGLFRQMIGRVLRPADGKPDAIVLDHSGAVFRHGLPQDRVAWSLDPDRLATAPAHQARLERKVAGLLECTQCGALRLGGKPCPACGFLPKRPAQYVRHVEGELGLIADGKARAVMVDRDQWHRMLTAIAREKGYKPGWASYKFKEKFGSWPPWGSTPEPIEPTPECRSWVRSRVIAFARSRSAA